MKTYELYENKYFRDSLGVKKENWEYIGEINVAVNYSNISGVQGNIMHTQYLYTGLTAYKNFERNKQYKIVADDIFHIRKINTFARYTQLELEVVA